MLKYALINNNKVENIIVVDSSDFIEQLKGSYQHIEFIGDENISRDIAIGYLWDGSSFFEDPAIVSQREEDQKKIEKERFDNYIKTLKEKPESELTEEEKEIIKYIQSLKEKPESELTEEEKSVLAI
jgi:adenylate kinase family enzyme